MKKSRKEVGYAEPKAQPKTQPKAEPKALSASARRAHEQQNVLRLTTEGPSNVDSKDFCGAFAALGLDNSWDLKAFKKGFKIDIKELSDEQVVFDMLGIDPPLVNAFRRILIAEVPTVAISRVTIYQNTSVIHDENLAHRLGLVPIKFEPDLLKCRKDDKADFTEQDSVSFILQAKCPQGQKKLSVYSKDLRWFPLTEQQEEALKAAPPAPVDDEILLAQLAPGQEIECVCACEKSIGKEHAKWSPVCTAFYRLHPMIRLEKEILNEDAEELKRCCPMGVFDVEDVPQGKRAVVVNERNCTTCRECLETFNGQEKGVMLMKAKNHFIFSIESVGQIPAPVLFERALLKFQEKCQSARESVRTNRKRQET